MKKLIILLVFIPLVSFGQKLNNNSDGYTEVIEVALTSFSFLSISGINKVRTLSALLGVTSKVIALPPPFTGWSVSTNFLLDLYPIDCLLKLNLNKNLITVLIWIYE